MKKRTVFLAVFTAALWTVSCIVATGDEKPAAEEPAAEEAAEELTPEEQHRQLLERVHAEEMKRLEAMKKVAEEREREDMIAEADELIAAAAARHAAALKQFEKPEEKEPAKSDS